MDSGSTVVPIACRFIPHDQWLVTHFDPTWKITQVKLWILSKCFPARAHDIGTPRYRPASFAQRRPISPITFAPASKPGSLDGTADSRLDYEGDDDLDGPEYSSSAFDYSRANTAKRHRHQKRGLSLSISSDSPPPLSLEYSPLRSNVDTQLSSKYTLIRFSTGQILEDEFPLSWYELRPHELLELHRSGVILQLPRVSALEYATPYFEAKVLGLRVSGPEHRVEDIECRDLSLDGHSRKRKVQLQWTERWLVIREGVFKLCKACSDNSSRKAYPLSTLLTLKGFEHIANIAAFTPRQRIVCSKFKLKHKSTPSSDKLTTSVNTDPQRSNLRRPISSNNLNTSYLSRKTKPPPPPARLKSNGALRVPLPVDTHMFPVNEDADDRWWSVDSDGSHGGHMSPDFNAQSGYESADESADAQQEIMDVSHDYPLGDTDESGKGKEREEIGRKLGSERGQWIVLDLLDDHAYTSLLRILHRSAPHPLESTFAPTLPALTTPTPNPTPVPSPTSTSYVRHHRRPSKVVPHTQHPDSASFTEPLFALRPAFGGHPYPEWRIDVVRRGMKAGLGEVGKAMEFVVWGDAYNNSNEEEGVDPLGGRWPERQKALVKKERRQNCEYIFDDDDLIPFSPRSSPVRPEVASSNYENDSGHNSEEETSEAEWEGWIGDLERQCRVSDANEKREKSTGASGSDYDGRYQLGSAQRELQEERRALEPSAVVTSSAGSYPSSYASTLALTPAELYSSTVRPVESGIIMRSTSTSQLSPISAALTSASSFNFSPMDDPLSSATSPSKSPLKGNEGTGANGSPSSYTSSSLRAVASYFAY